MHSNSNSRLISNNNVTLSFSRTSEPGLNGVAIFDPAPAPCDPDGKFGVCGVMTVFACAAWLLFGVCRCV